MSINAGFEYIDGDWEVGDPGIGPEEDWMISVADLDMCFITISTADGNKEYFFGANPTIVDGVEPEHVPDYDIESFDAFFAERYPEAKDGVAEFVRKYRIMSTDTESTYDDAASDGGDLVGLWCETLGLPNPLNTAA
ncbi:hypothetical protein [Corynebacterium lehmanniae]|uniref:Uncharacterized protein n=1 Tax=Corynebacterium lehmanniae TaxID=2913497 RepID=A0ABT4R8W9_9CORY|nr:hypothetical protein [Corynebacterium lehmanniae]MCZ9292001.1 hypothetical protein [Corynebacterium lehmanniae]